MLLKIAVAVLLAAVLVLIIISLLNKNRSENNKSDEPFRKENSYRNCPLCGTPLLRGETVHSHLFPGKPDGMMYIYGCPFCHREHPRFKGGRDVQRICPFCKGKIPEKGWVIARVFEKPEKTHVHVLGCTVCRKGK
ncbi:MAG: hypothetical protein JXR86_12170 [Spirochaetales bacterium]|nr:hypothetical protein [Spirochaetales bacterium]